MPRFRTSSMQLNWKSTLSSRMLLDSSLTYNSTDIPQFRHTPKTCDCVAPAVGTDVISALDSSIGHHVPRQLRPSQR